MKELIREIRESKGVSQVEFAQRLGVSQGMLSMLESGERRPGRKAIKGLLMVANRDQQQAILNELRDDKMGHDGNGKDTKGGK